MHFKYKLQLIDLTEFLPSGFKFTFNRFTKIGKLKMKGMKGLLNFWVFSRVALMKEGRLATSPYDDVYHLYFYNGRDKDVQIVASEIEDALPPWIKVYLMGVKPKIFE